MTFFDYFIIALAILAVFIMLVAAFKTKKPVKAFLFSSCWGIGTFAALNIAGIFTGFSLAITPYTLGASAVFGLPGVLCMTLTKMLWGI